ncbi:MAG: ferritin-like domain-containing protein [Polyangiaceae bacterium]
MNSLSLQRLIQRAVLLSLGVGACGGIADNGSDDGGSGYDGATGDSGSSHDGGSVTDGGSIRDGSDDGAVIDSGSACAVTSTTPLSESPCYATFSLNSPTDCEGPLTADECAALCPANSSATSPTATTCSVNASPLTLDCQYTGVCGTGRRPEGLLSPARSTKKRNVAATFLCESAHLEAASVHAFRLLERNLKSHRAPAKLRRACLRAAADEVRHARVMRSFARRAGGVVPKVRVASAGMRSLESIAIENMVEGCVRETFGAAVATFQAKRAPNAGLRRAMEAISQDETRHAALSWQIARWLDTQLDESARTRVNAARARAVCELAREIDRVPAPGFGLPNVVEATSLFRALSRLWTVTPSAAA